MLKDFTILAPLEEIQLEHNILQKSLNKQEKQMLHLQKELNQMVVLHLDPPKAIRQRKFLNDLITHRQTLVRLKCLLDLFEFEIKQAIEENVQIENKSQTDKISYEILLLEEEFDDLKKEVNNFKHDCELFYDC